MTPPKKVVMLQDVPVLKTQLQPAMAVLRYVLMLAFCTIASSGAEGVILLHGLCRTTNSMNRMESALEKAGYTVLNVEYRRSNSWQASALSRSPSSNPLFENLKVLFQNLKFGQRRLDFVLILIDGNPWHRGEESFLVNLNQFNKRLGVLKLRLLLLSGFPPDDLREPEF